MSNITPTQRAVGDLAESLTNALEDWWTAAGQEWSFLMTVAEVEAEIGHSQDCLCDEGLATLEEKLSGVLPGETVRLAFDVLRDCGTVYHLEHWDDAVAVGAIANAAYRLGMLQVSAAPDKTLIPASVAKYMASRRHIDNRADREFVVAWFLEHAHEFPKKNDGSPNKNAAALDIFNKKLVNQKLSSIRRYLTGM